jgi:hypothetical protein
MEQIVCQRLCPAWQSTYECVEQILGRVVRVSSVVECLNSVVRMHQARHRSVPQKTSSLIPLLPLILDNQYEQA